ncbi:MAG: polyphosphate kinase 2 [Campylobacterales bacterium]|nr:polyphosphate kinase 2 [Campylobacterales bacterium]
METTSQLQQRIEELEYKYQILHDEAQNALRIYEQTKELELYQAEMIKLQQHIEKHNKKLIIIFEGRDAAGKGSLIGTVSRYMNPKHYRIVALGKPTKEQKTQWYFQKYVEHFPSGGQIVLFDRSWYNRAMVEPVFGFCTPQEYEVFMKDVVGFERSLVRQDVKIIKLYLSVKKSVQSARFEQRRIDPLRQWKLSEVDLQSQGLWDEFSKMKYKMFHLTDHQDAPWSVIRSNDKHKARIEAMKLILNSFEYEKRDPILSFEYDPLIIVKVDDELQMMRKVKPELVELENGIINPINHNDKK